MAQGSSKCSKDYLSFFERWQALFKSKFPNFGSSREKKSIFVHNLHVQFCISRQTCDTWRPVSVSKCAFVFACYRTKVLRSTFENVETHSADEQCCFEIVFAETTGNHFC
jgi:hypothetical protein